MSIRSFPPAAGCGYSHIPRGGFSIDQRFKIQSAKPLRPRNLYTPMACLLFQGLRGLMGSPFSDYLIPGLLGYQLLRVRAYEITHANGLGTQV